MYVLNDLSQVWLLLVMSVSCPILRWQSTNRSVTRCPPHGFPWCTSLSAINLPFSLEYYLCSPLGRVVIWNWKLKFTATPNPQISLWHPFIWKLKAKIFSLDFILWEKLEMLSDSKTGRFSLKSFPQKKKKPKKGKYLISSMCG